MNDDVLSKLAGYFALMSLFAIGGANSAAEASLEMYRAGAHVTLVHRGAELKSTIKYWVRPDIENRIKEGEIRAFFNASVTAIREGEVDIMTADGPVTLPNDFVLAMTGYMPDFGFLTSLGITLIPDDGLFIPTHNTDTMETNVPGIYPGG